MVVSVAAKNFQPRAETALYAICIPMAYVLGHKRQHYRLQRYSKNGLSVAQSRRMS